MALAPHNNAIAYAHFRLRGGFKATAILTALAMAALGILIIITVRLANDHGQTVFGWATASLAIGAAALFLFGPIRISNSIRQDVQSKMIESHRLMPLPPAHAVAGYITGGAAPALVFFAGMFLVGGITASAASVNMARWTFACGVLVTFSLFLFVACAFASLSAKMGPAFIFVPLVLLYMSQGAFLVILPGVTVILSPIIGQSVFDLRGFGFQLPATYAVSFVMQTCFSAIFFIAATRKYRRADAIGLDSILGLCLLAGWVAISWMGLRAWEDFRPRGWIMGGKVTDDVRLIVSMICAILLAMVPLVSNARERLRWDWHERVKDPAPMRRPIPVITMILIATAMIVALPLAPTPALRVHYDAYLRSAAAIIMALAGARFVIASAYGLRIRAAFPLVVWVIVTWFLPLLADALLFSLGDRGDNDILSTFSMLSPIGTIILVWRTGPVVSTTVGLFVQFLVMALIAVLWYSLRERRRVALPL